MYTRKGTLRVDESTRDRFYIRYVQGYYNCVLICNVCFPGVTVGKVLQKNGKPRF